MMTSGNARAALGGFLLLFVASRLLYLVLINPGHLYYIGEELYRGTVAQELVTGLKMPFIEYRADNYSGGSLVIGALASGFFLLFGPTVFALKLAPLLVFTLALLFWYQTIRRAAGERVARYFALLFCFSPPLLTAFSVTAMGFHSESIFFSALTVFLLFKMFSEEKPSQAYPALLGLTAGFGLWFTYIYGLTLLALLGFWFWHDREMLRRWRFLCFALGFLVGFAPWIVINVPTHFAGLVIHNMNVWEHFGLAHLWDGLAHPWRLAPVEFLRTMAPDDAPDLYRRAVSLLYSLLYLGPILTAGVLRWKTGIAAPAGPRSAEPTLVAFGILYLVVFTLAVQFSDFRDGRYYVPAYPFLFLFVALSVARCQDQAPRVQRQVQTVFLASVVVLGLGTHAPLLSLDQPGCALSAKGFSYALLPWTYWSTHVPAGTVDREFLLKVVQRPFLSDVLPKLSSDDQRDLSRAIARMLARAVPLNGQAEDLARIERLVPPGFDNHFFYKLGGLAMARHPNELPKAVAAVEFVRHRSAAAHHLALVGIYRQWAQSAALDRTPESLLNSPAPLTPELQSHYWRALGLLAGRSWHEGDHSLSQLNAHLQAFVPRLDLSVQRSFLQGVGQAVFTVPYPFIAPWVSPAELERFPPVYQERLMEGWGMGLGEFELFPPSPWHGAKSPYWIAATKGFPARSLLSIQRGKAQFEALFESPASSALEPPLHP
ncbi:MAG: glycosyltransferase family 39 protein [Nitrospirae bacterium]|nr:MAG: glycosyltransferase family 39 protein [Nitrospirota bacterium]